MSVGNDAGPRTGLTFEAGLMGARNSAGKAQGHWQDGAHLAQRILWGRLLHVRCNDEIAIKISLYRVKSDLMIDCLRVHTWFSDCEWYCVESRPVAALLLVVEVEGQAN